VVGAKGTWYERLGLPARATSILAGFDFVIGLPLAYAQRAGLSSFREALSVFGAGEWESFYQVCRAPCEVTLWRPFFPESCGRRGMAQRGHLSRGLGLTWAELHRECEKRTLSRPPACPLFWTLGANQVGKASISGWLEVLRPITERGAELGLWPFDGPVAKLLEERGCVVAETYPAEFYGHLGLPRRPAKRSVAARKSLAERLFLEAELAGIELSRQAAGAIASGFGARVEGEDYFDAMVGLLGMVKYLRAGCTPEAPDQGHVRNVEGWILGQTPAAGQP
jgi:hypothetical protein